ncbi:MAG: class I tRNA ligase family protein [Candidatus Pacebacteria bacterium]|nr:class I tRNA ligase family protein [Candidatus Paceibacterota bacterium]
MAEQPKQKTINEKELETLASWQENEIFEKSVATPAGESPRGQFSFYDGPPFATGMPHHGTLMAGTVKDVIPRYQTMKGNSVRRVWGWDCHGLPIENLIEKKLGLQSKKDIEEYGIDKFNKDAFDSVLQYEAEWKKVIPRLGRFVDMEHPYKTMDATYTESIWWAWKQLMEKGLAYEGHKMMHICPRCETPLAQSEVGLEYHDVTDLSVTAEFELVDEPGTFVLAWTTTPWTLPGNTALAVNKTIAYVKVKSTFEDKTNYFILAKSKVEEYFKDSALIEVVEEFTGVALIGKSYKPVFSYFKNTEIENKENIWKIWHADFITEDAGTGIAHEAPAFGAEDMELAKANNIPVIKHVKMDGTFIDVVTDFAGMKVKVKDDTQSADIEIIKYLAHNGTLFEKHKIIHSYPLCWRCKTPLLNYATSSWFVDVPKMKEKLLSENQSIGWTPEHIRDGRFGKWLEGAREWAVSRTRYWGAPLPVWKNADGSELKVIGSLKELAHNRLPKNTYYVMRHGQAQSNVRGIIEVGDDITNTLTDEGKAHIEEQSQALREHHIDMIVASPVLRSMQTAEIVSRVLGGVPVVCDDRLRENNVGVFNGKTIDEYLASEGSTDFLRMKHRPEGGETHEEIQNRMMAVFMDCEKEHVGKTILFISHGGPLRMLIAGTALKTEEEILADEMEEHTQMYLKNGEFQKLDEVYLVPRDETGAVNLHRPYIDDVTFVDSKGETMKRIPDVFDCWFESGSMPFASLHYPFENKDIFDKNYPADFIAESMDQTRGWFYSLINLGVGLFDKAPYKHVICNGLINGADGQKISKSLGNYTDPLLLVEKFGADAFRYYMMSSPVIKGESVNFKDTELEDVYKKLIMRLENVLSLYEMNKPASVSRSAASEDVLDTWIISRVHEVVKATTDGYEQYKLDEAVRPVDQFVDDLSVWYVRRARSRLKGDEGEDVRNRTYETLSYVLHTFARTIAPVMPFIAERIYTIVAGEKESVHLESWPGVGVTDGDVIARMKTAREVVSSALMKRTESKIAVRQPLATLTITEDLPESYLSIIQEEVNVKAVTVGAELSLDTTITEDLRIEGDIRNLMRAVQDKRKEMNLSPKDGISLTLQTPYDLGDVSELSRVCNIQTISRSDTSQETEVALSQGSASFTITL